MDPKLDSILLDLYYNIENSSAFSGIENLYKTVKRLGYTYTKKEIKDWLFHQKTYTLHYPLKKRWKRSRIITFGPMWLVEGDLAVIADLKHYTSFSYLLLCVCTFSKYLFARPLKTKKAGEVVQALEEIFKSASPGITYFRTGKVCLCF